MKKLKFALKVCFTLMVVLWQLFAMSQRIRLPLYEPDEAAWTYSSYYFNLYFLKFDLFHEDWNDDDAFDHPPLVKYILGAKLFMDGHVFDSLDAKRTWRSIPPKKYSSYYDLMIAKVPVEELPSLRLISVAFSILSVILLHIFLSRSYGFFTAFMAELLLVTNPVFLVVSTQVLADPVLLFCFISFVLFCSFYLRSGKTAYIVLSSFFASFAFLTKINGAMLVGALPFIVLMGPKQSTLRQRMRLLFLCLLLFGFMTIALNPTFLNSGIQTIPKLLNYRLSTFQTQQAIFQGAALSSMSERMISAFRMIFLRFSIGYDLFHIPLELIMFLMGAYYSIRKKDLISLIMISIILFHVSLLPLNWERYYYIMFPFVYAIAGLSLRLIPETLKAGIRFLGKDRGEAFPSENRNNGDILHVHDEPGAEK